MFRHERPQKGRYRQFHQFGVEALGFAGPDIDAEQIVMCARLWTTLGLDGVELHLNSHRRRRTSARAHRDAAGRLSRAPRGRLDEDARARLHTNPLRVLDSKNPAMQEMIAGAPKLIDDLGAASRAHFEALQAAAEGRGCRLSCRIRGSCAGSTTTTAPCSSGSTDRLGAQATVCAGGRYDGALRAARRQAHAGVRFRDGRRARARADAARARSRRPATAGRLRRASGRGSRRDRADAWRSGCATRASTWSCTAAVAASSRR